MKSKSESKYNYNGICQPTLISIFIYSVYFVIILLSGNLYYLNNDPTYIPTNLWSLRNVF